ncbi:trans-cinnamate 4-monooxygenase [Fagus crenata]
MDNYFSLVVYHGGNFVNNLRGYEGGIKSVFDNCDPEKWSKIEIDYMVRELGYALISRLWFRVPGISIEDGGLQQINSDHDAMLMTELVPGYGEIEVFVEHIVEEPIINSDFEDVDDDYNVMLTTNSDDDSWDSVEDDEQPEVMSAGVLHSDYESEDLYSDGQGLTESESDGNNVS